MGPALLFSGTAIGVSHLVQSTRAGAVYGLALVGVIIISCILKYPSFRFGVDYAHATGRTLFSGYRAIGMWALVLQALAIVPFAPIPVAAVAATTAGLLLAVTGLAVSMPIMASILLIVAIILVLWRGYDWLDKVNRFLMAFLVLSTVATTLITLPQAPWGTLFETSWVFDPAALIFIVALAGFLPNPMSMSGVQSVWTRNYYKAARRNTQTEDTIAEARIAFSIPYVMTTILAVCFCIMGAGVMYQGNVTPEQGAVGFAVQIVNLYREALGGGPVILAAIAAVSTMLTTLFVAVDATGRSIAAMCAEIVGGDRATEDKLFAPVILLSVFLTMALLFFFQSRFLILIDLATALAFIVSPLIATLNHVAILRCDMNSATRPGALMQGLNIVAIATMSALAIAYFYFKLT